MGVPAPSVRARVGRGRCVKGTALNISPGALKCRVEEGGWSFQAIKDPLRRDLAINRRAKTRQALAEVAAELGFADSAAFYRAFVRWTGMAPAHYRQRLQAAGNGSLSLIHISEPTRPY